METVCVRYILYSAMTMHQLYQSLPTPVQLVRVVNKEPQRQRLEICFSICHIAKSDFAYDDNCKKKLTIFHAVRWLMEFFLCKGYYS